MINVFDVTDFGAIPDGKTDSTKAIQKALDEAGKVKGQVVIPPGKYSCGQIKVPESVTVEGTHGWGYRDIGGTTLILNDENATCLIDLTAAFGSMIKGLQLVGEHKGENVHGFYLKWDLYNGNGAQFFDGYTTDFHEDSFVIEDCQVRYFSGDAAHLEKVFAFTIRNSHFLFNDGNGIYVDGWDGWITNSIIGTNGKYAFYSDKIASALTIIGNRVEWNRMGGFYFTNGGSTIINSNAFDRSMGPAIEIAEDTEYSHHYTITSNNFNRSGKPRKSGDFTDEYLSSHVYIRNSQNITITGNLMSTGVDDGGGGKLSPDYGIVYKDCEGLIIEANADYKGAVKQNVVCLDK